MVRTLLDIASLFIVAHFLMLAWLYPKCGESEYATFAPKANSGWVCVVGVERK